MPHLVLQEYYDCHVLAKLKIVDQPLTMEAGMPRLPDRPATGIELRDEVVAPSR